MSLAVVQPVESRRFGLRALLGYGLVIATIAASSLVAFGLVYHAASERDHVTAEYEADAALAEHLRRDGLSVAASVRGYLLTGLPAFLASLDSARADFAHTASQLRLGTRTAEGGQILDQVVEAATRYSQSVDRLIGDATAGQNADTVWPTANFGSAFEANVVPLSQALDRTLDVYVATRYKQVEPARARAQGAFRRSIALAVSGIAIAVLLSTLFARRASRELLRLYSLERDSSERANNALAGC